MLTGRTAVITGGAGGDNLTGGLGADTFVIAGWNDLKFTIPGFDSGMMIFTSVCQPVAPAS